MKQGDWSEMMRCEQGTEVDSPIGTDPLSSLIPGGRPPEELGRSAVEADPAEDDGTALARLSMFRKALALGAKLLARKDPEKAQLFKRGHVLLGHECRLLTVRALSMIFLMTFVLGAFAPVMLATGSAGASAVAQPASSVDEGSAPTGSPGDFQLGAASSNLTTSVSGSIISVMAEEYKLQVDYRTSYVDYKILPYFSTDFIRYRRVNPQYWYDGTYDSNQASFNSLSMTISKWGRIGNKVWFLESCPEFSLNQTFTIYRDYFELNVTYKPGTVNVCTTYFFGLYSASNSLYPMVSNGHYYRYVPGYEEDRAAGAGMGRWYPSLWMYAPACDMRAKGKTLGLEVGLNETVCYLGSPIWMNEPGTGGENVFSTKYFTKDSIIPDFSATGSETFHLFVRPYQYTDGKDRGYDVGYAQWVAPKVAAAYGNPHTSVFPLLAMDFATYSTSFKSWLEASQIKVATQSDNPDQIDWNYKCCQLPNTSPGTPSTVPVSWQVYSDYGTPMTISDGRVICNPISGPYNVAGTFRWQLINNDPYMDWWTGSRGVFWDMMNMWSSTNVLRHDYNLREDFIMTGYLALVKDSFASGYWDYVMSNTYTALLQPSIASSLSVIEGYQPSSIYGTGMVEHVHSTMNFTANIPEPYRPKILVYQNYDSTNNSDDQEDVYSALWGSAKYGFYVTLLSYDSFSSQMHNYVMAEDMFKAMGCTRDSDVRTVTVDTLDTAISSSLSTSAQMVVIKGGTKSTITEASDLASFIITNLHATSNDFDLRVPGGGYFVPGSGVTTLSAMTYTADGYAKFSGRVAAEKTATLSRSDSISVYQHDSGSASVALTSAGPNADLTVQSSGGTTEISLKGFVPGKTYKILVNSVVVEQKTAASDGSIKFSRAYGSSDHIQTQLSSAADTFPPHVSGLTPANGATSIPVSNQIRVTFNESMDRTSTQAAFGLTGTSQVAGGFTWESGDTIMAFTPSQPLQYSTTYTVQVSSSAKDISGNFLSPSFSSSFVTEQQPRTVPSAPRALTATGGARTVLLGWSAPLDSGGATITGYRIYRGTSSNGQSGTPLASLGNVTSYQDVGASDGTTYYYKVSAVNSAGEGAPSTEAMATTFSVPGAPAAPTAVGSYRSVSLSWSAPSNNGGSTIIGYRVYRGAGDQSLSLLASLSNVLAYTDSALADGTRYYYKVSAVNAVGEGSASAVASATTSSAVPGQPADLHAICSSSKIALSWSAPSANGGSAITSYKIYRGSVSGQLSLHATLGNVLSYDDSGLSDGSTYFYQVSALNAVGEGARSSEVQGTTGVQVPSAPLSLRATASDGKAVLSWGLPMSDGGSPIQTYQIYRAVGLGQMELIDVIAPAQGYEDTGLTNGVTYRYQVSASNQAGEGPESNETSSTPMGLPGTPLNLQALPSDSKVALSWAPPSNLGGSYIVGYRIYRGDSPSSLSPLMSLGATTSYEDATALNGHLYYYAAAAINSIGEGASCSPISCVPGYVPSAPVSLLASPSDGKVTLTWGAPLSDNGQAVIGYSLYRGLSSENLALLTHLGAGTSYVDQSVSNGVTYYYRVTASNSMGEGAFSPLASAKPATLPGAPSQLSAIGGAGWIDLSWSTPTSNGGDSIVGYAIYRGVTQDTLAQVATTANTAYRDSGLTSATLYRYEIKAINSIGQGPSAAASASTAGLPGSPSGLSGSASATSATLVWSPPGQDGGSDVTGYNIYRGTSGGSLSKVASATGTTFEDRGLDPGKTYRYAVAAVNGVGEGLSSPEFDIATLTTVPSSPSGLKATSASQRIDLAWSVPPSDGGSPVTVYSIYRGTSPGQLSFLAEATTTSYSDRDVSPGQSYYYQVAAVNSIGESGPTSEVNAKAMTVPSAPQEVQGAKGKSSVGLTWRAPDNNGGAAITGYVVYRGSSTDSMFKLATIGSVQQYTDSSLPKTTTAYYRVSAVNAAGEGQMSEMISVTLTKKASAPRNLAISSQDGKLLLSWDAPEDSGGSNITSYAIYRRPADGALTKVAMVNSTYMLDMGLTNGVTYAYSIAAINMVGEGNLTSYVTGKPFGLPSSPPYLNATPYDQMVLLNWNAPADDGGDAVAGYDIFVIDGTEERYLGQVASSVNSYVCNGLKNGVSYVFKVAAVNAAGESERCSVVGTPVSAALPNPVGGIGLQLGGDSLIIAGLGALAAAGIAVGVLRTRSSRASTRSRPRQDMTVRVQVAQARTVKSSPRPAVAPIASVEDAFERTVRDLEVSGRIL